MGDNRLPPQNNNRPGEDTVPTNTDMGRTRPNSPYEFDDSDTEANARHKTEMLPRTGNTQQVPRGNPGQHVEPLPNAPQRRQPPPPYGQRPRRGRQQAPDNSALYLPWWSIALMLVGVLVVSFGIIGVIYLLGGSSNFRAEATPIIMIVTAPPEAIAQSTSVTSDTQLPATQIIIAPAGNDQPLNLDGPTLVPVQLSATPAAIQIGSTVIVEGVGEQQLNVRDAATLTNSNIRFRVSDGTIFTVTEGPVQESGFTWWRIQDPNDVNRNGWAVSNFLQVTAP
ncbi:MAG: hypothetical protein AAFR81_13195 [Chloroflexota bacterium]